MPPDGDPPFFGSSSDFSPTFFLCVNLQTLRYTPVIYKNLEKFQEDISQVSHYQPSCHFYGSDVSRERLEPQLTILKMHP